MLAKINIKKVVILLDLMHIQCYLKKKRKKKDILILGKSPRDGLSGNAITELIKFY